MNGSAFVQDSISGVIGLFSSAIQTNDLNRLINRAGHWVYTAKRSEVKKDRRLNEELAVSPPGTSHSAKFSVPRPDTSATATSS